MSEPLLALTKNPGRTRSSSAAGDPAAPRRTRAWAAAAANAATASATLRKYVSSCAGSVTGDSTFRRMRSSRRVELWISCEHGKKACVAAGWCHMTSGVDLRLHVGY